MKSVMKHDFSNTPTISAQRSSFDRSFGYKTTFDAGLLIPFMIDDVLPGDTFTANTTALARLSTPEFPFMDNMYMDTHFFFVPWRLVWENARKFFGEQENPADSIDYEIPSFSAFTCTESSLHDYMGLPLAAGLETVSLYARAYNLIWNEWFRDQNLQDSVVVDKDDGPDTASDYTVLRRGKRHDYFTSCLPWPQKGDAVTLPLGVTAPVIGDGTDIYVYNDSDTTNRALSLQTSNAVVSTSSPSANNLMKWGDGVTGAGGTPGLQVDLTAATAASINDIREAFQVQRLLERDAMGGTRYSELVRNHFGVNFYDVSYRPEFLGGGSTPIKTNPVAATNRQILYGTSEIGDLGAYATAGFSGHGFTKSFVEHGIVMGLVSVRADLTYQQGVPRQFNKKTRYDIFWPSLAHLGNQAVLNSEIYYQNAAADDDVFGYQNVYDEYRYKPSQITSAFRSTAATPLDAWHLSQEFTALPVLGDTFIQENPPVDRVIIATNEPHFIFDSYTSLRCARPIPVNGTPGMIDHF